MTIRSCCGICLRRLCRAAPLSSTSTFRCGREPLGLAPPVVQHGGRADDERRLRVLPVPLLEPRQPRQRLQGLAQAHVVRQNAAQPDAGSGGRGNRSRPSDRGASRPARAAGRSMAGTPSKFLSRSRSALAWARIAEPLQALPHPGARPVPARCAAPPAPGHPRPGRPSLRAPTAPRRCPAPPSRSRAA